MIPLSAVDDNAISQERFLARARIVLATASFVALYVDPTEPVRPIAYGLLLAYVFVSVVFALALVQMQQLPRWAAPTAHAFDVLWLALLTAMTGAASSPLFGFFAFVVLAAAFRWGHRETLATTFVVVWVLLGEAYLLMTHGLAAGSSPFELNLFLVRITYMAITGVLLAYLASHEKKLRLESALVARILSRLRSETTLDSALEIAGGELLRAFGARSVAMAVRESSSGRTALWTLATGQEEMQSAVLSQAEADDYLAKAPAACILKRRRGNLVITATTRGSVGTMATTMAPSTPFNTALVVSVAFEEYWFGRIFIYDPSKRIANVPGLRLLSRVMEFTTPALHSVFLIRRLRSRSEASERARLARELHDTSVQSLIGLEMDVMALSRRTGDPLMRNAIDGVHARLQQEILGLRNLMAHLSRSGPPFAGAITDRLTEILAQFQVETGIRTRLLSSAALAAPPRISQEIVRLVEAAMSNVRRHSGATQADVILERAGNGWRLVIQDDGVSGREGNRQRTVAPWSIRERVTALGGQLVVEPRQDAVGVRVEIRLPTFVLSA